MRSREFIENLCPQFASELRTAELSFSRPPSSLSQMGGTLIMIEKVAEPDKWGQDGYLTLSGNKMEI
jgi:hypothetical protein